MTEGRPTIVIVDDAPDVRSLLRARLRLSDQFDVVAEGADGHDAVALAQQHAPSLMLLDVSMPGSDGLEALPTVLEVSPSTRVVMFSGFEEQGLAERARALGAADFIEKSVPVDALVERLLDAAGDAPAPAPADDGAERTDERVLAEHLERFREVFDEAAIGMATMTLTGRLIRANRALASLVGRHEHDLVGAAYADLTSDPEDRLAGALEDIRTGPVDVVHLEHTLTSTDANRLVRATLAPVRDSVGRALYLFMQLQDVTAEQVALEELRRSEERFRLLVEAVEDYAIFMLDPDGHIVSWNSGAQRSELYTADEIIGQHFRVFYPPEVQAARHPEHELEVALREGHYEEEGWRVRKDGSRFWANVLITAVFNAAGEHVGFAKITRDMSRRRQLEQEREAALDALARANQELESLNEQLQRAADDQAQFLAVTAHELRTPIGLLAGSAETLSRHSDKLTDEERGDLFAAIASGTTRLRRLLTDLLTASRLESSALEMAVTPVPIGDVLVNAASTVRTSYPTAQIEIPPTDGVVVAGDPDRLAQALENLLGNAVRHGTPPVRVDVETDDSLVRVRISDEGDGVPPALRPRLFERFAAGRAGGGTGLGLYIVRQLARAQDGEARYEEPTPATPSGAFVLELPRMADSPGDCA